MVKKSRPSIAQKSETQSGSIEEHEALVAEIILAVAATKLARLWPQKTGAAYRGERLIHYGLVGSADISGILLDGKRLEIEVKTGGAKQTKDQKAFQKMILEFKGIYILARSIGDVMIVLNQWQRNSFSE